MDFIEANVRLPKQVSGDFFAQIASLEKCSDLLIELLDEYQLPDLQDISKEGMITPEEEADLARKIRKGDQVALHKMTKANLRFVVSVAKQYQNQGLTLPDLINEGNLGLIKAAQRFDETRGFKFISYAVWWIRQSILQALAEQARIVRLPSNKIGAIQKINKTLSKLEQQFEREPSVDEVANILELTNKDVSDTMKNAGRHVSMDAPVSNDESSSANMYDLMESSDNPKPDSELVKESLRNEVERILSTLTLREAEVVNCFFGLNGTVAMSLEEIAQRYELTRERVRQIKEKAIRRLKQGSKKKILKAYLG